MKSREILRSKIGPFSLHFFTDPYIGIGWGNQSSWKSLDNKLR